jgi:hypothetical protein
MEETKRRTVEIKGKSPGYKAGRCVYIPKEPGPTLLQEQSLPAPKALSLAIGDIRTTLELWRASLLRRVRGALAGISLRESSLGSAWVRWNKDVKRCWGYPSLPLLQALLRSTDYRILMV